MTTLTHYSASSCLTEEKNGLLHMAVDIDNHIQQSSTQIMNGKILMVSSSDGRISTSVQVQTLSEFA